MPIGGLWPGAHVSDKSVSENVFPIVQRGLGQTDTHGAKERARGEEKAHIVIKCDALLDKQKGESKYMRSSGVTRKRGVAERVFVTQKEQDESRRRLDCTT
jgi:hypothetical protein